MEPTTTQAPEQLTLSPNNLAAVFTPAVGKPKAAVLLIHGLTGDMNQKGHFVSLAADLGGIGISSLRFDMRGRGKSPGAFTHLSMIEDIGAAAKYLTTHCPGVPSIVVARGEGAYGALVALGKGDDWHRMIFWGAILFPRTSRELQGDYHAFREDGKAVLRVPSGDITFNADFFEALEKLPSVYEHCSADQNLTFIHAAQDPIAPVRYVQEFCNSKKCSCRHKEILPLVEPQQHMHIEGAYVTDYRDATFKMLSEDKTR